MRLIDADALKRAIATIMPSRVEVNLVVDDQPDAIVRCKDCKHYPNGSGTKWTPCREIIVPPFWFCADGERKEGR